MLYNGKGNQINLGNGTSISMKDVDFNFDVMINFLAKNTTVTPIAEFKSETNFGDKMYCGGMCVNDKIYFCPNTADNILVYDTINDYLYEIGQGLGSFAFKFTGMVQYKGFLYCVPRGVNFMLQINPVTDEVLEVSLSTDYAVQQYSDYRDSHHYNGCISNEGWLYLPPAYASTKLLKINMNTFECRELDFTCEHSTTWQGCCSLLDNKILFIGNKGFRVWNCNNDSIVADVNFGSSMGIYDMVLDPRDGCLYGFGINKFVKFNPSDNAATNLGYINYLDNGTYGTMLGADGKFYTITPTGAVMYEDKNNIKAIADSIATCNTAGMTVCSAGLVLANDGSIYSVPGNGRLIKVSFNNIAGKLPNYITTSKFYGKY